MKSSPLAPVGAVLIVCLWSSGAAHADPIVWNYDWSRTPSKIFSDNGHSWITLTDESPKALTEGVLALQLHQGFTMDVQFKDIKIKLMDEKK